MEKNYSNLNPSLHFSYGVMGSSKSATALMLRYQFVARGFNVLMLKPSRDTRDKRDGKIIVSSRIGIEAECLPFENKEDLIELFKVEYQKTPIDLIVVDECQFMETKQVEQLRELAELVPVYCFGLLTNFKTELFPASKRLVEIADTLNELEMVCKCGKKANVNARFVNGKIVSEGNTFVLGGDKGKVPEVHYESRCYECWKKEIEEADSNEK